ncbi:MAG: TonB-dependent receptor [Cytophagales bacterium]|nr:MAG: TonB-dependent receptor [Cytophagales bacterium]
MKKIFLLSLTLFCLFIELSAQNRFTISGYIKADENSEDLIGVNIVCIEQNKGTITNEYGFYSLTLDNTTDSLTIVYSYLGYSMIRQRIKGGENQTISHRLTNDGKQLNEVVISADSYEEKINNTQMSVEKLTMEEMKLIPVLFGEVDLIKTLQLKPGVKSGGEGSSGLYVRGGGPDQNLVLLDDAIIYNASHLFGFFSVFNSDAIKEVELYKGDFPAQYGGRLSSVLDVKLKEGNKNRFAGTGGIGLISSRLTLEVPIQKEKSSIILSGRRTYFDVFTRAFNEANKNSPDFTPIPDYYFYDLNLKANYEFSEKDRLFFSAYYGRDVFGFRNNSFNIDFNWGNTAISTRWNHVFSPRLFSNLTLYYAGYQYEIKNRVDIFSFRIASGIQDYTAKLSFDYLPTDRHSIRFGVDYTYHTFEVGRVQGGSDDGVVNFNSATNLFAHEMAVYITDDFELSERWRLNMGLRWSAFSNRGQWYQGLEPRFSARYKISDNASIKASIARMYQYLHLVSNSGASLPTDIWYPSSDVVYPQISDQVALGASITLFEGKFLLNNELYYKEMQNQVDLKDGASIFGNPQLEQEFVFGKGWSYGNEIYFEKKTGKLTGWIGYTLSWTWRQFGESNGNRAINDGSPFFPRYDRRHDVAVVLMYKLSERLSLSAAWVYNTGNAYSLPTERVLIQGPPGGQNTVVPIFRERNGFRIPDYHRLDLGVVWKMKPRKHWQSDLTFSVYNAYNRRNAYFVYFEELKDPQNENITTGFRARQVALFPIIPTITYNFKF